MYKMILRIAVLVTLSDHTSVSNKDHDSLKMPGIQVTESHGYKNIRMGVLQGHCFNNTAVLLARASLQ